MTKAANATLIIEYGDLRWLFSIIKSFFKFKLKWQKTDSHISDHQGRETGLEKEVAVDFLPMEVARETDRISTEAIVQNV